jgi:hypothetical protein
MVPCAELRVFQPLDAFPPDEKVQWERFIIGGGALRRRRSLIYRQRSIDGRLGFLESRDVDGADVRLSEGTYYVCPWRTRLRVLAALLSFNESVPFEGAEAFLPDDHVRKAAKELAKMRRRDPRAVSCIMQSPWHVPVRWFVLFDDEERRLVEEHGRHRLLYTTNARRAVRRTERAVPVLRKSDLGPVADLIVEMHQWLALFDPRSLVELDYDGLCDLLTWDELDDDHSARDVQEALNLLSSDELPRSAELYQAVISRWAEMRNHESMN